MQRYDAIVIGGGHNGLVHAAYLAKAGKKVLVLERRHVVGGATITEEIYPGFKFLTGSYLISLLRPDVIRELELPRHGLEIMPLESTFVPLEDGNYFAEWPDHDRTRDEIARHSLRDADAYGEYAATMRRLALHVKPLLDHGAAEPGVQRSEGPRRAMARIRDLLRRLPQRADSDLLARLMTMSAADFLDEWFEGDALKGDPACTSGIIGTFLGPRSPGVRVAGRIHGDAASHIRAGAAQIRGVRERGRSRAVQFCHEDIRGRRAAHCGLQRTCIRKICGCCASRDVRVRRTGCVQADGISDVGACATQISRIR